ncbi:RNA polymerase sigma factor [Conexibacter sp. CPCC 206217]|uniref:RNA polymerase sigma factor n=1 Tax=Conexibacter sp. CPCC 206217 TaxID=3064574 RepID=UPI002727C854|nr:sigma-70 family RNA polymerase sigma factor [Conexibacter sp. CPCC 206217]MDO8209334.1 sigma-70 family RNA polymerase sigma factor [Conexibacter sp. CPCC 206217]
MTQPPRRRPSAPLDADDFGVLYRRHAQSLLLFFQRRLHDAELAMDLMGEVFATALDRRAQYRGSDESELSGWLWAIARSTLRDHERRGVTERRGAARMGVERRMLSDREIERIEELAGLSELRAMLAEQLAELPDDQRTAVQLRVIDDLTYREVADRMGVRVPTARAHVSRALRRLSRELLDSDRGDLLHHANCNHEDP